MGNTTASSEQTSQYIPPKMWKDLSVEEKIERIREQVKSLQYNFGHAANSIENLKNDLNNHAHLDGKVVKDIRTYNITTGFKGLLEELSDSKTEARSDVYF